jgi:S1-C subfamily serine protease
MLKALASFLCLSLSIPAQAKLGETVPQLIKRFGKSYTIKSDTDGKNYSFRSEKLSVDVLVTNGVSVLETYFSDRPLNARGEPPNEIVRAVLKTNVPRARWLEIDAAPFRADYALQSSDHEYIALVKYAGPQPENSVWTMTVGPAKAVGSISTATPGQETTPLITPTPTASAASPVVAASATPAPHIDFSPEQFTLSPPPKASEPLTPTEIFRRARASVVLLRMQDSHGQPVSLGSGFFIDKDVVATNFHVIDQAAGGYAKSIGDPTKLNIKGTLGIDVLHDLALLEIDSSVSSPLPVATKLSANVGDTVYAIGNPQGLEGTFSQGIVSSVRTFGSDRILQITAPISPGSSGGPVLDQTGTVVGVSFASIEKGQNLNFAIPCDYLAALQRKKTQLQPFTGTPRARLRSTLLGRIGNERPLAGVVGENLTYDSGILQQGEFSFSLHNKLRDNVTRVYGVIIFHDVRGQPIDVYPISYGGVIPAGTAKRIRGQVDPSVERLNAPMTDDFFYGSRPLEPRPPKGNVELRILDFTVANE